MLKTLLAVAIASGFATASFAQGTTPGTPATPAVPVVKATVPAPIAVEKKVETPKAAEPAKAAAAKTDAVPVEAAKAAPVKAEHASKAKQPEAKVEKVELKPEAKPTISIPAPAVK